MNEPGDMLNMDRINSLPQPFIGVFLGGDRWPIEDIDVQTGLLQVKRFSEVVSIVDDEGNSHASESLYNE
jgi:hypothetical protein